MKFRSSMWIARAALMLLALGGYGATLARTVSFGIVGSLLLPLMCWGFPIPLERHFLSYWVGCLIWF